MGLLCGLGAAAIWGTWPVVTSMGVNGDALTPFQLVLTRFAVAGPLLLPFAFRGNPGLKDWGRAFILMLGAGFAYSMVVSTAFVHAPASHGGVIIPGTMLVVSLTAAHFLLGERMTLMRVLSVGVIVAGLALLALGKGAGAARGDLLFVLGGIMWAGYTFFLRRWPTDGLVVAARVSALSALMVGIGAAMGYADGITAVARNTLALQGVWQGIVSAILALVLFNKAVGYLGSGRAATLNALIPVIAVTLSFLVLGEEPGPLELVGLLAVILGIASAMGIWPFRLPRRRDSGAKPACPGPEFAACSKLVAGQAPDKANMKA
jgi:drug/metabolite transporter (DMT)-like permease